MTLHPRWGRQHVEEVDRRFKASSAGRDGSGLDQPVGTLTGVVSCDCPARHPPSCAPFAPGPRAACQARVGDEMRAEAVQARPEVFDEQQCGVAYGLLIPLLVLGEPLPVVVALELAQEIEQVGAEEGGVGHRLSSRLTT